MKMRKILATIAAAAVACTMVISASAAQDTTGLADGTAYLNLNNCDWNGPNGTWTNVEITGDGDYVVKGEFDAPYQLGQFNALEVVNGETKFGSTYVITVTSIKVNGEEVKTGDSYTCSADGAGVTTRVNLFNEWNEPDAAATAGDDKHLDNRCAGGDVSACTARLWNNGEKGVYIEDAETVEVAFTVSGIGGADEPGTDEPGTDEPGTDEPDDSNKPTGATAGLAFAGLALAAAAVVVTKKNK